MKKSPSEHALLQDLSPSKFSARGFLGTDTRPVDEIINEDFRVLEQHQVSKEAVAEALTHAYEKARGAFGAQILLRTGITAVFHESMGRIPSPFKGDGVFEKGQAVVKDDTGHALTITALGIHLIKKHGFFQGKGSPYRIEPEKAIKMFRLVAA